MDPDANVADDDMTGQEAIAEMMAGSHDNDPDPYQGTGDDW